MALIPPELVQQHLHMDDAVIAKLNNYKQIVVAAAAGQERRLKQRAISDAQAATNRCCLSCRQNAAPLCPPAPGAEVARRSQP